MLKKLLFSALILAMFSLAFAGDVDPLALKACRKTCDEFSKQMSKTIHDAILEKGLVGAIDACAERINSLCREFSKKPGLSLERITALKLKEQRRLNKFEGKALKAMIVAEKQKKVVKDEDYQWSDLKGGGHKLVYIRPIKVQPVCLACHGPANMVPPDVKKMMQEKYKALPSGNQIGEIKGALLVELELPAGEWLLKEVEAEQKKAGRKKDSKEQK